eukprot:gene3059-3756_t
MVRELKPINLIDMGLVKRVRGLAFSSRVSPSLSTRVIDSARSVLNHLLPDVYIHTDHYQGRRDGGSSPGYAVALVAESTTGVLLSYEKMAVAGELPEDVGRSAAIGLLEEIRHGGCIDRGHQPLVLLLMVVCPEDVCKVRFGSVLTESTIETLNLLKDVFGVVFKIKEESET